LSEKINEQKALLAVQRRIRNVRIAVLSVLLIWAAFGCSLLYFYEIGYGSYPLGAFLLVAGVMLLVRLGQHKPKSVLCIPDSAIDNALKAKERGVLGLWRSLEGLSKKAGVRERIALQVLSAQSKYLCMLSDASRQVGMVVVTGKLMKETGEAEMESLVSHEIGHFAFNESRWLEVIEDVAYFFRFIFFITMACVSLSITGMVWFVPSFGVGEMLLLLATEAISLALAFIVLPRIKAAAHRQVEHMADAYGCYLVGTDILIDALQNLESGNVRTGIAEYLSGKIGTRSHPLTADRAKAIRALRE